LVHEKARVKMMGLAVTGPGTAGRRVSVCPLCVPSRMLPFITVRLAGLARFKQHQSETQAVPHRRDLNRKLFRRPAETLSRVSLGKEASN